MGLNSRMAYLMYAELSTTNAKMERAQIKNTRTMDVLLALVVRSGLFSLVPRNAMKSPTTSSTTVSATASVPA